MMWIRRRSVCRWRVTPCSTPASSCNRMSGSPSGGPRLHGSALRSTPLPSWEAWPPTVEAGRRKFATLASLQRAQIADDVGHLLRVQLAFDRRHQSLVEDRVLAKVGPEVGLELLFRIHHLDAGRILIEQLAGDGGAVLRDDPYEAVVGNDLLVWCHQRLPQSNGSPSASDRRKVRAETRPAVVDAMAIEAAARLDQRLAAPGVAQERLGLISTQCRRKGRRQGPRCRNGHHCLAQVRHIRPHPSQQASLYLTLDK